MFLLTYQKGVRTNTYVGGNIDSRGQELPYLASHVKVLSQNNNKNAVVPQKCLNVKWSKWFPSLLYEMKKWLFSVGIVLRLEHVSS